MNEKEARKILEEYTEEDNNGLHSLYNYVAWEPSDKDITLDGVFEIEELEAMAWWMRCYKEEP